ncbi:thiamine biosynthesis protein ThiF [Cellulomonas sp. McL0617]|uniref:thiamine biosynthesis protein ThiF n=1 Tax=Cellulomonas sp. McL0617 TaxID=3415675 RepID=UPI003CEAEE8B
MRLRDGLRVVRRTETEVQVGTDPRWAVRLTDVPAAVSSGPPAHLLAVDEVLLDLLTEARLTRPDLDAPVASGPAAVDARVWSLLRPDGDGSAVVQARDGRAVAVLGLGPTGLGIAIGLAAAGVGTVLVDDDRPVRAVDVGPTGYRWTDVGSVRAAVAARLLRDVAPRVSTEAARPPDVVVLVETDVADPDRGPSLVAAGTVHLSVVVREADTVVGPLVVPGRGPCLRCLDLHRTDADPAWPALLGQLRSDAAADEPGATACVAAGLGTAAVLAHLDGGERPPPGSLFEVAAPDAVPRMRTWAVHPHCGCTALPAVR